MIALFIVGVAFLFGEPQGLTSAREVGNGIKAICDRATGNIIYYSPVGIAVVPGGCEKEK